MENDIYDGVILAAGLLLAAIFLIFGWRKLTDYSGTVSRMVQDGANIQSMRYFDCKRSVLCGQKSN
jgi:putative oxidoreductase